MSAPPPRKRFQVHLSTAIILMFATGGLIWANVVPLRATNEHSVNEHLIASDYIDFKYGWPFCAREELELDQIEYSHLTPKNSKTTANQLNEIWRRHSEGARNSYVFAFIDILIALLLLVITWFLCERWIAYRASRRDRAR